MYSLTASQTACSVQPRAARAAQRRAGSAAAYQQKQLSSSRSVAFGAPLSVSAVTASAGRQGAVVFVTAAAAPPTLSETKRKFIESWKFPIPALYNGALQELLASQHFVRYNTNYEYSPIAALGFVSVYDQLFEGYPAPEQRDEIFKAFVKALNENPDQFRKDAAALTAAAQSAGSIDAACQMDAIVKLKSRSDSGKFTYSKFMAIGLFRLLELVNATEPTALSKLAAAAGVPIAKVNADLTIYKGLLSKLAAAKELQAEFLARERKRAEERAKEKAAAAAAAADKAAKESPATASA